MKYYIYLISLLIITSCGKSSNEINVIWNITLDNPVKNKVYIVGNQDFLGNWDPGKVLMQKEDSLHWTFKHTIEKGKLVEYKISQGSWEIQMADEDGLDLSNFEFITPKKDTVINIKVENWTSKINTMFKGQITGNVAYHKNFHFNGLIDRDIIVWLPPSYSKNVNKEYPVLYMHDGQNIIDPKTSSFGVDWQVDETVNKLIEDKQLDEIIIVGSYCTQDRSDDYGDTEKGQLYRKSFAIDLKNFIDHNYRTKKDKQNTVVAGSSMGGLVSFMLAWEYPEIYKGAICMSPAFKYEDFDYINSIKKDPKKDLLLYIDNGGKQVDIILQEGVEKMKKELEQKGYKEGKDLFVVIDKNARHSEGDWAKRFPFAIELFFKKK